MYLFFVKSIRRTLDHSCCFLWERGNCFLEATKKLQAMSYGERKAKREQEIAGLKEALTILSGESLLQVKTTLRGARRVYLS